MDFWQIFWVVYVAGFMASIVPITKAIAKAHADTDYHGNQKPIKAEDFWFAFMMTIFLASWIWPVILIGLYFKQLVMEPKESKK